MYTLKVHARASMNPQQTPDLIDQDQRSPAVLQAELTLARAALLQLANDLHDGIAQDLVYLAMRLPLLEQSIAQSDLPGAARYANDVAQTLGPLQARVRQLIEHGRLLSAPVDFFAGLQALGRRVAARAGLGISLAFPDRPVALSQQQQTQALLIASEALSNIARHAKARQVSITVRQSESAVELSVCDDGVGQGQAETSDCKGQHFGMLIMRERAQAIGAQLTLESPATGGTEVRLTLPLAQLGNNAA